MSGDEIYDNGPIDGNTDAWTINFGFVISDTFTAGGGSVTGMNFGAWLTPGDTLNSAEVSITSEPNGGTSYFDQIVSFSQGGCPPPTSLAIASAPRQAPASTALRCSREPTG